MFGRVCAFQWIGPSGPLVLAHTSCLCSPHYCVIAQRIGVSVSADLAALRSLCLVGAAGLVALCTLQHANEAYAPLFHPRSFHPSPPGNADAGRHVAATRSNSSRPSRSSAGCNSSPSARSRGMRSVRRVEDKTVVASALWGSSRLGDVEVAAAGRRRSHPEARIPYCCSRKAIMVRIVDVRGAHSNWDRALSALCSAWAKREVLAQAVEAALRVSVQRKIEENARRPFRSPSICTGA